MDWTDNLEHFREKSKGMGGGSSDGAEIFEFDDSSPAPIVEEGYDEPVKVPYVDEDQKQRQVEARGLTKP